MTERFGTTLNKLNRAALRGSTPIVEKNLVLFSQQEYVGKAHITMNDVRLVHNFQRSEQHLEMTQLEDRSSEVRTDRCEKQPLSFDCNYHRNFCPRFIPCNGR